MTIGVLKQPRPHKQITINVEYVKPNEKQVEGAMALWNKAFNSADVKMRIRRWKGYSPPNGYFIKWGFEGNRPSNHGHPSSRLLNGAHSLGWEADSCGVWSLVRSSRGKISTACHELGHALGLWHEQWHPEITRQYLEGIARQGKYMAQAERDNYKNRWLDAGKTKTKYNVYFSAMDAKSVMLYGSYGMDIGQNKGPSEADVLTVGAIFGVNAVTPTRLMDHPICKGRVFSKIKQLNDLRRPKQFGQFAEF